MLIKKIKISFLDSILLFLFITLGYLGFNNIIFHWNTTIIFVLWFVYYLTKKGKKALPNGLWFFLLFLCFYLISFSWSIAPEKIFHFFIMFVNGFLVWVLAFNDSKKNESSNLDLIILFVGLIYGIKFLFNNLIGNYVVGSYSLILWVSPLYNHHHIGILGVVSILVILNRLLIDRKRFGSLIFVIPLTLYVVIRAMSRSSILALIIGLVYLVSDKKLTKNKNKVYLVITIFLALLYLIISFHKSVIFTQRPYFFQAIEGFSQNLKGIGVGNFKIISDNPDFQIEVNRQYSIFTHNLVLELMVGIGVLTLPFIFWLARSVLQVINYHHKEGRVYGAIFIMLFIDFMFDFTYFVPALFLIWMASLGIFQQKIKTKV